MVQVDVLGDGPLTVEPARVLGAVLWFSDAKGYGFVLYNEVQHFVHYSEIRMDGFKSLQPGQLVTFVAEDGPRGAFCSDVRLVGS